MPARRPGDLSLQQKRLRRNMATDTSKSANSKRANSIAARPTCIDAGEAEIVGGAWLWIRRPPPSAKQRRQQTPDTQNPDAAVTGKMMAAAADTGAKAMAAK
ncbi:hypothetical protein, partial [Arthrobacter sp. SO5]|uniref:hypothetical protein n=1 Tax=Arthrobacter sp. SO5 TaxID=1897055 RepID=UPI001E5D9F21